MPGAIADAPASVKVDFVGGGISQRNLGLELAEFRLIGFARRTGVGQQLAERRVGAAGDVGHVARSARAGCRAVGPIHAGRVGPAVDPARGVVGIHKLLAVFAVVTTGNVDGELIGHRPFHAAEHGLGVTVLDKRKEGAGVNACRVGAVLEFGHVDGADVPLALVDPGNGGAQPFPGKVIAAELPAQRASGIRGEADFLAPAVHVHEGVLRAVEVRQVGCTIRHRRSLQLIVGGNGLDVREVERGIDLHREGRSVAGAAIRIVGHVGQPGQIRAFADHLVNGHAQFLGRAQEDSEDLELSGARPMKADALAGVLRHLCLQVNGYRVARRPAKPRAQRAVLVRVNVLVPGHVMEITVPVHHATRQTKGGVIADRAAVGTLHAHFVGRPVTQLYMAFRLFAGRLGGNDDRSVGGVAAIKRALRTLGDLDLLGVEHLADELARVDDKDIVHDDRHGQFAVAHAAQAPHRQE